MVYTAVLSANMVKLPSRCLGTIIDIDVEKQGSEEAALRYTSGDGSFYRKSAAHSDVESLVS